MHRKKIIAENTHDECINFGKMKHFKSINRAEGNIVWFSSIFKKD
jgi:hypothetical protein